jgi:ABC-type glycerol-3-phosphate transport system substrate-binding protein
MDPIKCQMIAGSVGMQLSSSGAFLSAKTEPKALDWRTYGWRTVPIPPDGPGLDTIQPGSGWWMFEVKSDEDILEEKV